MSAPTNVTVVGGGIGGIAASIALRNAGLDTTVLERAAEFGEIGAAIGLTPNGVAALDALGRGIGAQVRRHGHAAPDGAPFPIRTATGRIIANPPRKHYATPWVAIRRVTLHAILLDAHGEAGLHAGSGVTDLHTDDTGVTVVLDDGRQVRSDLLVGADGLRSTVRAVLLGAEPPRQVASALNGITPDLDLPAELAEGFITLGEAEDWGRISVYCTRLSAHAHYWGFAIRVHDDTGWPRDAQTARAALLDRLGGWAAPVPELVRHADDTGFLSRGIFDRPPAPRWGSGPTTLLGDAAHPMNNSLGQGANAVLEDAAVLGACLAAADDPVTGLRDYEAERIPRTTRIVQRSADTSERGRARAGEPDTFDDWLHGWTPLVR